MLFSKSARSWTTIICLVILASLAFLAAVPKTTFAASCLLECTPVSTKILFCGNIRDSFQDKMPVIGVDSGLDRCLCTQENVRLYRKLGMSIHWSER